MAGITLDWLKPDPSILKERERILASRYFLVYIGGNAGAGEVWRCKRCGGKHRYLTLQCIEQPFSGVSRGLYAFWKTVGDYGVQGMLNPEQRARFDELSRLFGPAAAAPDLATRHPWMAQRMAVNPEDGLLGAIALGVLVPIDQATAQRYVDRINATGLRPKLAVPGLRPV